MTRIAIIGAGLAGLTVARQLRDCADVTVVEKSAGYGGRMATRHAPPYEFDHGAQFFTAKSAAFQAEVSEWLEAGVVDLWRARFKEFERSTVTSGRDWDDSPPHYVGVPAMNRVGKYLAEGINVQLNTAVKQLQRSANKWLITTADDKEFGPFDWVISTAPPEQTRALLPACSFTTDISTTDMLGCCALMLGFADEAAPAIDWQAAMVREADISWVSVSSSKPGRDAGFSIVVHSTNAYAETSMNDDPAAVEAHLLKELAAVTGIDTNAAEHTVMHRWRYANIRQQTGKQSLLDDELHLGVCGDWLIHGRVEAAFLSGLDLANNLRQQL